MNEADQLEAARRLFKAFHHREPNINRSEIINVGGLKTPTIALAVGQFIGIGYKALGDRRDYYHEYPANSRPLVYVSSDGRQVYILEGGYRFTERGFIR